MDRPRTNIERLVHEGYEIQSKDMPKEYVDVIESLRPEEIELIVDVTRRLERARECLPGGEPHYNMYMPPF
ncbi:MAG TPA: hypothetical protein VGF21_11105 [Thermoleophilaceae bacterium]|jgi:hypothetical protein